jgi:hypothetical protein
MGGLRQRAGQRQAWQGQGARRGATEQGSSAHGRQGCTSWRSPQTSSQTPQHAANRALEPRCSCRSTRGPCPLPPGKRRQSQANLSLSASQDSLAEGASPYASSGSLAALGGPGGGSLSAAVSVASVAVPGSSVDGGPFAAVPLAAGGPAAAGAANGNGGGAGARAAGPLPAPGGAGVGGDPAAGAGSHIALHWLSRPRNVLVMRKLAAATEGAFQGAVSWLL